MNGTERRAAFIKRAEAFLGCNEYDGSHRKIIDIYNANKPAGYYTMTYSDPWCSAFVSAVSADCGLTDIIPMECGCERHIELFKSLGVWREDESSVKPQPGDIVFYNWDYSGSGDNTGFADHVGIIAAVSGDTLTVIEGNMSNKVGYRSINRLHGNIRGFALPAFGEGGGTVITVPEAVPPALCTVELPVLREGDAGESVKALQLLLIGRGFSCGPDGADGELGKNTRKAVLGFQGRKNLEADGIAGRDTWSALHGV